MPSRDVLRNFIAVLSSVDFMSIERRYLSFLFFDETDLSDSLGWNYCFFGYFFRFNFLNCFFIEIQIVLSCCLDSSFIATNRLVAIFLISLVFCGSWFSELSLSFAILAARILILKCSFYLLSFLYFTASDEVVSMFAVVLLEFFLFGDLHKPLIEHVHYPFK